MRFLVLPFWLIAAVTQASPQAEQPLVRITVNLVQIDAVVTDSRGRHVPDLKAGDFEVFQDGKRRRITAFSHVRGATAEMPRSDRPAQKTPDQQHQMVALVVDDLGLSAQSIFQTRGALREFIERRMRPGDQVAIVRTSGGVGVLQQFTSDKRRLLAAVERLRAVMGRQEIDAFDTLSVAIPLMHRKIAGVGQGQSANDRLREKMYTLASRGALNLIIRGLHQFPGRKCLLLFSENVKTVDLNDPFTSGLLEAAQKVTDSANRSSVVIDAIDPRGVVFAGGQAANEQYVRSIQGLAYLADQTGGLFLRYDNDLAGSIERALADKQGYYLIGYVPPSDTFKRGTFHRLALRLKRPGFRLRYRQGFLGVSDETAPPSESGITAALVSPFNSEDVRVKLTPVSGFDERQGPYITSLLHINAQSLRFMDEPGGWLKAAVLTLVATFDENGKMTAKTSRPIDIRVKPEQREELEKHGVVYAVGHWVKQAGVYQLRAVVEDLGSRRIGSAASFVEVPDARNRLALGGILLGSVNAMTSPGGGLVPTVNAADPEGSPAVRMFKPGAMLRYEAEILSIQTAGQTSKPELETRMMLYRDGKRIYRGEVQRLQAPEGTNYGRVLTSGQFSMPADAAPGEYVLELVVIDRLAQSQDSAVRQVIDFEVVR
jgi:VWFA-related protein